MPWTDAIVLIVIGFLIVAIPGTALAKRLIGGKRDD